MTSNPPTAPDAAAEMSHVYKKMVREALDAGHEIPAKPVPASLGEVARGAVAASQRLYRSAQSRTFSIGFSLRDIEARAAAAKAAQTQDEATKPAKKPRAKRTRAKGS